MKNIKKTILGEAFNEVLDESKAGFKEQKAHIKLNQRSKSFRKACKAALKLNEVDNKTWIVLLIKGRHWVVSREMFVSYQKKSVFKKSKSWYDARRAALFVATGKTNAMPKRRSLWRRLYLALGWR